MIQVRCVSGQARFKALATGSTCTASPSALSMTIATRFGGERKASTTVTGLERSAQLGRQRPTRFVFPLLQRALQAGPNGRRTGRSDRRAIEIEHPGLRALLSVAD